MNSDLGGYANNGKRVCDIEAHWLRVSCQILANRKKATVIIYNQRETTETGTEFTRAHHSNIAQLYFSAHHHLFLLRVISAIFVIIILSSCVCFLFDSLFFTIYNMKHKRVYATNFFLFIYVEMWRRRFTWIEENTLYYGTHYCKMHPAKFVRFNDFNSFNLWTDSWTNLWKFES